MADTNTYQVQANELSQKLWAIANELRGQMDASEFKNYILGVIFYRYLSERTEMYMAEILKNDGVTYEEAFADDDYRPVVEDWSLSKLGYVIKPERKVESSLHLPDRVDSVRHLHPWDWTKQRLLATVLVVLHPCCWKFRSI